MPEQRRASLRASGALFAWLAVRSITEGMA
jgi:hypothetical protein